MTSTEVDKDDKISKQNGNDVTPPLPPDGGWGWVIVVASLFCNIIVDGVCFSFGIFYVEFLLYFGESKSKTAWVGSLVPGMYLSMGPVVSALANKFGCRRVTICGSVVASIFFFLSTFSPNINWLIFTYGVMGGIGFGLMYLPSIVIVGYYFDKKRALATGLAVCGSGIGTFLFAPLGRFLLDMYGWKGANWIIAGIILHGIACGLIFIPLEQYHHTERSEQDPENTRGTIMQKIIEEKNRQRTISTGSLNNTIITKDNTLIRDQETVKQIMLKYNQFPKSMDEGGSSSNLNFTAEAKVNLLQGNQDSCSELKNQVETPREVMKKREVLRPMYRADIFYSGSVTSIPEYAANPNMSNYVASVTSIPEIPNDTNSCAAKCMPLCSVLGQMLDFSLLKSITFVILCTASVLAMTGFFTPFVYITDFAIQIGIPINKATFLLSILGIFNTLGRVISGWLSDRPWADCLLIHNCSLIIAGVATCAVPWLGNYVLIAIYCAIFGSCIAAYIALRSIVLVDLLGVQKLSNAFGILLLFQGIASIIGSPLSGALYDITGSYTVSFLTCGILIMTAGIICLPIRCIARWESAREKDINELQEVCKEYAKCATDTETST